MQCLFLHIPDYCQPDRIRANRISLGLSVRDYGGRIFPDLDGVESVYFQKTEEERQEAKRATKAWKKANPDKVREQRRRENATPHGRVRHNQRVRFVKFMKKERTTGRLADWIGCDWKTLVVWLEDAFEPGMTWDNYGTRWHIDHVKPLAKFDLLDEKQAAVAWHFSNLQPLWAFDNMSKGSKFDE